MKQTREEAIENIKALREIEAQFKDLDAIGEEILSLCEEDGKDVSDIRRDLYKSKSERKRYGKEEIQKLIDLHHIKSWEIL